MPKYGQLQNLRMSHSYASMHVLSQKLNFQLEIHRLIALKFILHLCCPVWNVNTYFTFNVDTYNMDGPVNLHKTGQI